MLVAPCKLGVCLSPKSFKTTHLNLIRYIVVLRFEVSFILLAYISKNKCEIKSCILSLTSSYFLLNAAGNSVEFKKKR